VIGGAWQTGRNIRELITGEQMRDAMRQRFDAIDDAHDVYNLFYKVRERLLHMKKDPYMFVYLFCRRRPPNTNKC
jgi:hypothetical protein